MHLCFRREAIGEGGLRLHKTKFKLGSSICLEGPRVTSTMSWDWRARLCYMLALALLVNMPQGAISSRSGREALSILGPFLLTTG
jgi:hypothetical protein